MHYVVAEVHRCGYAACFDGNMPESTCSPRRSDPAVSIQVESKYGGRDWRTTMLRSKPHEPKAHDGVRIWVLGAG